MFFKYVTLLAFAATAIAGAITPGVYRLTNVASQSTARSYDRIALVFVSSSKEDPGPYELWDIRDSEDGSYTLKNLGLNRFAAFAVFGRFVGTGPKATPFNIEPAGNGEFVIKLPHENSLWMVGEPVIPNGDIELRPANGKSTQRWVLTRVEQNDYDERLELVHRIGRFLGQF